MSEDKWTDAERIQVLEGQVSALEHLLVTLINILGTDARDGVVEIIDLVKRTVRVGPTKTSDGFFGTFDSVRSDLLEPDAIHGGDSDGG